MERGFIMGLYIGMVFFLPTHIVEFDIFTGLSYGFLLFHQCYDIPSGLEPFLENELSN